MLERCPPCAMATSPVLTAGRMCRDPVISPYAKREEPHALLSRADAAYAIPAIYGAARETGLFHTTIRLPPPMQCSKEDSRNRLPDRSDVPVADQGQAHLTRTIEYQAQSFGIATAG